MKTKRGVLLSNIIATILFIIPINKIDLFTENYSTLSLSTRGYLYVLFTGIFIGIILAYETYKITSKVNAIIIFSSMLVGVIIPHHVPYNLQGNLHLLFAYIGFAGIVICTILNCHKIKNKEIYSFFIFISIVLYLKFGMVTKISEIIVMLSTLFTNLYLYLKS